MYKKRLINLTIAICSACLLFGVVSICKKIQDEQNLTEVINLNKEKKYVYPLGQIVGIKATTDGVLVVGYEDDSVEYIGGIKKGDNIVKINNKKINNVEDVANILKELESDKVEITFERKNKFYTETVKVKNDGKNPRLGLWVRDKISGIGTITFYDPDTSKFNGIGHPITDVDTNTLLKIKQGYIYDPTSFEIVKGSNGDVGAIKGEFNTNNPIGKFTNNSNFGISGDMLSEKKKDVQLIEIAKRNEVKLGKASILFEDENGNITSYDVKIVEIIKDAKKHRNLVIEVVDKDLLSYTGGIVQGMSGVPIIQNNKIIGAITHVFKDDYKKGYGIFADEMIELDKSY